MDAIEVIRKKEQFQRFLNEDNIMEIVVRQKNKRFKKFYKVTFEDLFNNAEERAAEKVVNAVKENSELMQKSLNVVKNLEEVENLGIILTSLDVVSTWASFAILYEKLNAMEDEIVGAIQEVQQTLNKSTELHIKTEYNKVISDYQDMLDCRKKQKPYSEEQMRMLVDSLYVVLDMVMESLKSDLIHNKDNMILSLFMLLSMYTTSLLFFDEQYYFNYKDILSGDEVWHTSHNKWVSLYDTLTQSWFIELLQDHGIFDLHLNLNQMDIYYKEMVEQILDQKQDILDNQEIILSLQDVSLLKDFREQLNEGIHEELDSEVANLFKKVHDEDCNRFYDALKERIQYA